MSFMHHDVRVILRGRYGAPQQPASLIDVTAEREWASAVRRGAARGLRRYSLGEFDADQLERGKTPQRAIGPDFKPSFNDEKLNEWTQIATPDMQATAELIRTSLEVQRANLEKKIADAGETPNADDVKQLRSVRTQLSEFNRHGYLETVPDAFGDGSTAMYHSLGTAGVGSHYISNRAIDADAAHCLRFWAWQPTGNAKWEFSYTWSWWRLVISGQDVKLIRFRENLTSAQRRKLEQQISELEDRGRLTSVDQKYINAQRAEIAAIEQPAKDEGRELDSSEKVRIQGYQRKIEDRQNAKKGLSRQQEAELDKLKGKLYVDSVTANLYAAGKDFFNQPITLTFIPDARGYLIICLGDQSWSYTDKTIRTSGFRGRMWARSTPEISCNGGAYVWQRGAPAFRKHAVLELESRRVPYDGTPITWNITGDWDSTAGARVDFPDPALVPGSGGGGISPLANFTIDFSSDGRTPAMLHRCTYYAPPAGVRDTSDVYFDSNDHLIDGDSPVEDLELSYNDERDNVTYTVTLLDVDGFLNSRDAVGRRAEVWIDGERLEKFGIVKSALPRGLAEPDGESEEPLWRADSRLQLVIGEQWDLMDADIMHEQIAVDGMRQGAALLVALSARGVEMDTSGISESSGIMLGTPPRVTGGVPRVPLLDKPLWRPGDNVRRGAWLRKIDGADDTRRLHLARGVWTFDTWDTTPVAEFISDENYVGRYMILDEVELPEDSSETFNCFTVVGGVDERTGKRITMTRVVYESLNNPNDPRYLGYEKWYDVESDESLTTEEMVMCRLDALERDHCLPTKTIRLKTFFHTTLRPKRDIIIRGLLYKITAISSNSIANDDLELAARRVFN